MIKLFFLLFFSIFITDTVQAATIPPTKIILITLDGVRWQDMFDAHESIGNLNPTSRELAPTIYKYFVDNGMAIGKKSNMLIGGPAHVSMPGYIEILTGQPSLDCTDNDCPQNTKPTLINSFPNNSAVFASWETISKTFDNSLAVVNIGRNIRNKQWLDLKLLDNQIFIDDFGNNEYRSDYYTQEAVLDYLRIGQPQFLWAQLGDTDEYAHQNNMLFYWASIKSADEFIEKLIKVADPNTVFIITTDHGRSEDFKNHHWEEASHRVWVMIYGKGIPKAGFVKYDRDVYLSNIYPTIMDIISGNKTSRSLLNYEK